MILTNDIFYRHNDIIKIEDSAFKKLKQLKSLDLSKNKLTKDALFKDVFRGKLVNELFK